MTTFKPVNPIRDEAKAQELLRDCVTEWMTVVGKSGNARHGFEIRWRNRLMAEAGYDHNEAYYALQTVRRRGRVAA